MDNPIPNESVVKELKCEESFRSIEGTETKDETSVPIKDPDKMLSMIVLLLACLALAALALWLFNI